MTSSTPRWPWITLVALEVIQLLSLLPWLMMAGMAFMAFSAPGSTEQWQPWAFAIAIWSYPLWIILAGVVSWMLLAWHRYIAAIVLAAVFTFPVVALGLWLVVISML